MKRMCAMFWALALLACCFSGWAEEFDFSPYGLSDTASTTARYGIDSSDCALLDENNFAAECSLSGTGGRCFVWWRAGNAVRSVEAPRQEGDFSLLPRSDGSCAIMGISPRDEDGNQAVTLYDWEEEGLANGRLLLSGRVLDGKAARDGAALLTQEGEKVYLSLFDGFGGLEAHAELPGGLNSIISPARVGEGVWAATVNDTHETGDYQLLLVRGGEVVWRSGPRLNASSVYPDGQGGFFAIAPKGRGTYYPLEITRYDENGSALWRKTLTGDKVVLSAGIRAEAESGRFLLYGEAMANSRSVYRAFCVELDENGNTLALDARDCDYGGRIYYELLFAPHSNRPFVLWYGAYTSTGLPAALAPWEDLPRGDNPSLRLK